VFILISLKTACR